MSDTFDARKPGQWVLFGFTFPWAVISYVVGLITMALFLTRKPRFEGAAIMTLVWRDWLAAKVGYSTTLGRLVIFHPTARTGPEGGELDERVERHERVHVRQVEDMMMLSFTIGWIAAVGHWMHGNAAAGFVWWLILWTSGGLWQATNFITAMCRYGWIGVYRDTEHERSAYAQTDLWNGESWWERRDKERTAQTKAL